jgi:hypothetical protein
VFTSEKKLHLVGAREFVSGEEGDIFLEKTCLSGASVFLGMGDNTIVYVRHSSSGLELSSGFIGLL